MVVALRPPFAARGRRTGSGRPPARFIVPSAGSPGGRGMSWSPITGGGIGGRGASPELELNFEYANAMSNMFCKTWTVGRPPVPVFCPGSQARIRGPDMSSGPV